MDQKSEVLKLASRYCAITGMAPATLSTKIMNDGKFLERIEEGAGFTIKSYNKIIAWFKANPPSSPKKKSVKSKQSVLPATSASP